MRDATRTCHHPRPPYPSPDSNARHSTKGRRHVPQAFTKSQEQLELEAAIDSARMALDESLSDKIGHVHDEVISVHGKVDEILARLPVKKR